MVTTAADPKKKKKKKDGNNCSSKQRVIVQTVNKIFTDLPSEHERVMMAFQVKTKITLNSLCMNFN